MDNDVATPWLASRIHLSVTVEKKYKAVLTPTFKKNN
jgi:hypothetical protein